MVVQEIMTQAPETIAPTVSAREAFALLQELDVRHLPVVDDGRLVGIISDRDVRTILGPILESDEADADKLLAQSVGSIMTGDVVTVTPETELAELTDVFLDQKVGAVPVVDPTSDRLVGIVSYVDLLRAARDLFEA
jgi:acetoin utilization protein AcuB